MARHARSASSNESCCGFEMQSAVPEPDFELAARLFDTLAQKTHDTVGITRASYGEGEQLAHDLIAQDRAPRRVLPRRPMSPAIST